MKINPFSKFELSGEFAQRLRDLKNGESLLFQMEGETYQITKGKVLNHNPIPTES